MVTAMILPTDNFTNVTIDNGKVLSDGQRNIVIGVGMPGLADNLDLNSVDEDIDLDIPEELYNGSRCNRLYNEFYIHFCTNRYSGFSGCR